MTSRSALAFVSASAPRKSSAWRLQADIFRLDFEGRDLAVSSDATAVGPDVVISSSPSEAVHHIGALGP